MTPKASVTNDLKTINSVNEKTVTIVSKISDTKRKKKALVSNVGSEGPDQTAHSRSLIRAFAARSFNQ